MVFNTENAASTLEQYLRAGQRFEHIHLMLFSHGVDSVGVAPIERWRVLLLKATKHGTFIGVDEAKYPRDFATFVRYHTELKTSITARYTMPDHLAVRELDEFLRERLYPVQLLDQHPSAAAEGRGSG